MSENHKEKLNDGVGTVKQNSYLDDRINSGCECEAVMTSRTRIGWAKFREWLDLLRGKKFPLKIKEIIFNSCVRSAMIHGREKWCLGQNEIGILHRTERELVRNRCGVKLRDKNSTRDIVQMSDLSKTMD